MSKLKSEQVCHDIYEGLSCQKSTPLLIQSIASCTTARSPTDLSSSNLYSHHYSSISQSISELTAKYSHSEVQVIMQGIFMNYFPSGSEYVLATDVTPMERCHSPKLADKQYIQIPNNVIYSNKSVSVGYKYSYVNVGYVPEQGSRWSLPLAVNRVDSSTDSIKIGLSQLKSLMDDLNLPFGTADLVIQTADSGYSSAKFMCPLVDAYDNMALVIRLRHGAKVWQPANEAAQSAKDAPDTPKKPGATPIYGATTYYLQATTKHHATKNGKTKVVGSKLHTAIFDLPAQEHYITQGATAKGRAITTEVHLWKDLLIRSKDGNNMKDKPMNIVAVQVKDTLTGKLLFNKPMFIAVIGKPKNTITAQKAVFTYRQRYDIEGHNRFSKQSLFFDKLQTPKVEILDNWTLLVAAAYWLLFVASDEVQVQLKPWERYLPKNKAILQAQISQTPELPQTQKQPKKSAAQTRKAAFDLFSTFDNKAFAPKSVKNGTGRKKAYKLPSRPDFRVVKKSDFHNETRQNE
jgi:hypothetical protein